MSVVAVTSTRVFNQSSVAHESLCTAHFAFPVDQLLSTGFCSGHPVEDVPSISKRLLYHDINSTIASTGGLDAGRVTGHSVKK